MIQQGGLSKQVLSIIEMSVQIKRLPRLSEFDAGRLLGGCRGHLLGGLGGRFAG